MNSLQGMFLIATNQMVDPRFKKTVILICSHDEHGALGLGLTSLFDGVSFEDILASLNQKQGNNNYPKVYCGGPVSLDALFILHPENLSDNSFISTNIMPGVCLANDLGAIAYFSETLESGNIRMFLGYSGWGAGQLEQELGLEGWLVLPATPDDIFNCSPEHLWKYVTKKHGIDISLFNDIAGNA